MAFFLCCKMGTTCTKIGHISAPFFFVLYALRTSQPYIPGLLKVKKRAVNDHNFTNWKIVDYRCSIHISVHSFSAMRCDGVASNSVTSQGIVLYHQDMLAEHTCTQCRNKKLPKVPLNICTFSTMQILCSPKRNKLVELCFVVTIVWNTELIMIMRFESVKSSQ